MPRDKTLINYTIKRVSNGTELKIQSKIMNDFFKQFGTEMNQDLNWSGNLPYKMGFKLNDPKFNTMINNWRQGNLLLDKGFPNLSILRSENLDRGVRFLFKVPMSEKELKDFSGSFDKLVLEFYNEYVLAHSIRNKVKAHPDLMKVKKGLSRIEKEEHANTFDIKIDCIPDIDFTRIFTDIQNFRTPTV